MLQVLSPLSKRDKLEAIIFDETSTLGIRRRDVERVSLPREIKQVLTKYGEIDVKVADLPDGRTKKAPEYESVKKAALRAKVSFNEVYLAALEAKIT